MAHEIYFDRNGKASFAYVGKDAWHGHGNILTADSTHDEWMQASGFNFTIEQAAVQFDVNGQTITMPERQVFYRSDTNAPLSVMSNAYQIVQPATIMEFFRDLCSDMDYTLETAGVLKGGKAYWALAKTGNDFEALPGDRIGQYVLLSTACDGSLATTAMLTSVRVVCNNTLSYAVSYNDGKSVHKTRHSTEFRPEVVKQELQLVDVEKSWDNFRDTMAQLCETKVTPTQAKEYFTDLLRPKSKRRKDLKAESFDDLLNAPLAVQEHKVEVERSPRGFDMLWDTYHQGRGQQGIVGTAYGLVNAVTHYIDHDRGANNPDNQRHSAYFGQGAKLKQTALDNALAL